MPKVPAFPFKFIEDIDRVADEIRRKTIGSFKHPEVRIEKKPLKEELYFICSICRKEYGPVDKKKWKKILGSVAKASAVSSFIADRVIPGSGIPFCNHRRSGFFGIFCSWGALGRNKSWFFTEGQLERVRES